MQSHIVERLLASFTDLETAIHSAKKTLAAKGNIPDEIIERLDSYDGILTKQRNMAKELCQFIDAGNWEEVNRSVGIINGLSAMIRDDARSILSALSMNSDKEDEEPVNYC